MQRGLCPPHSNMYKYRNEGEYYGFGILLVEQLNSIRIGGFKLGFWFAQQGAIYTFVALIFFYAWRMNYIDRKYEVDEE